MSDDKVLDIKALTDKLKAIISNLEDAIEAGFYDSDKLTKDSVTTQLFDIKSFLVDSAWVALSSTATSFSISSADALKPRLGNNPLVKVRPVAKKYSGNTYVGFYIGDLARQAGFSRKDGIVEARPGRHNPAIYVPEIDEVIMGYGSWWSRIETPEDLEDITNADIQNTWYVKLAQEIIATKTS